MTTKKARQTKEQKLFDAVHHEASCLKEAGEPLHGLGPSAQYANAFDRYSQALKALVAGTCVLHVAEWSWNGYEGTFDFHWDFGVQLAQPQAAYEHDTRLLEMKCRATLDPQKPLDEELARLCAEAKHYDELCGVAMRWATNCRREALVDKLAGETAP